jgi:hypothetical protein
MNIQHFMVEQFLVVGGFQRIAVEKGVTFLRKIKCRVLKKEKEGARPFLD